MDRKFKPPFFSGGDIAPNCRACQAHKSWVKIAVLLRLVPAAQLLGSGRLARRRAALLELRARRRWIALVTGFGSQVVWKRSNRCAGERGGARVGRPRWVRILIITGGSSIAALRRRLRTGDDLQGTAAVRALFDVDVEDPFEKPGPTHARRRTLRVRVIA